MKKYVLIFWLSILLLYFIPRLKIDYPVTYSEAKEGYTAYSVLKSGLDTNGDRPTLLFKSDNNYLSTLGVYLRIPSIMLFGLENAGLRVPGIMIGFVAVLAFYLLAFEITKNRSEAYMAVLLFTISAYFVQINLFNLGLTLCVLFVLISLLIFIKKKLIYLWITIPLIILSSIWGLVFAVLFSLFVIFHSSGVKKTITTAFLMMFAFSVIAKTNPFIIDYIKRSSLIGDIQLKSYSFVIERRLSFGSYMNSPLIMGTTNFNRIAHNKIFYASNEFFKSLIKPFNFESLTSAFQSGTILAKEEGLTNTLPRFFFWEIPLIFFGLTLLWIKNNRLLRIYLLTVFLTAVFYKEEAFFLLIPLSALGGTYLFSKVARSIKRKRVKYVVIFLGSIYLFGIFAFWDLLMNHRDKWVFANDLGQFRIWDTLRYENKESKLWITDRLGEPLYYYLYYKKIDPKYYLDNREVGPIVASGIKRVTRVGLVNFGSFKYFEAPRGRDETWVGFGGEFIGGNKRYEEFNNVTDGVIFKKIKDVKGDYKFIGSELWFVKTTI